MKPYVAFALAALLAACQPAAEAPVDEGGGSVDAATEPTAAPVLALDAEGLRIIQPDTGVTRLLAFGAPRDEILPALGPFVGETTDQGHMAECGAGPLDYVDFGEQLTVYFSEGAFAGWLSEEGPLAMADGLSADAALSDVEAAGVSEFTRDTLETEFEHNGVWGMLDPDGEQVALLWAGVNCFFR